MRIYICGDSTAASYNAEEARLHLERIAEKM